MYWVGGLLLINYNHHIGKYQPTKKINNKVPCLYNQTHYDYRKNPSAIKYDDGYQ